MKTIKLVNRNQVIKLTHSGRRGPAGTITVGSVVTGDPGESVTITNVGTSTDAILNFVIPQGEQGDPATNIIQSVQGRTGDVVITKEDLNIQNVDNTSDADKPVSTAQQTELDKKVDKVTGKALSTNDYTTPEKSKLAGIAAGAEVNVQSDWNASSGDAHILNKPTLGTAAATAATDYATAAQGAKADTAVQPATLTAHTSNTGNPHSVTKAQVGLSNVNNTSDADKPMSTATKSYVDAADVLKVNKSGDTMTGRLDFDNRNHSIYNPPVRFTDHNMSDGEDSKGNILEWGGMMEGGKAYPYGIATNAYRSNPSATFTAPGAAGQSFYRKWGWVLAHYDSPSSTGEAVHQHLNFETVDGSWTNVITRLQISFGEDTALVSFPNSHIKVFDNKEFQIGTEAAGARIVHSTSDARMNVTGGTPWRWKNTDGHEIWSAAAGGQAIAGRVATESINRFTMNTSGRMEWGSGAASRDTNLYRSAANELKTDDKFVAVLGLDAGSNKVSNVADPTLAQDSATKSYVDTAVAGKQNADATLTALASHNSNGILTQTAADTFTGRTITGTTNQIDVTNGDGVAGNPTLALPQDIHTSASPTFAGLTVSGGLFSTQGLAGQNIAVFKDNAGAAYVVINQYGRASFSGGINSYGHTYPGTDSTYTLGTSSLYWKEAYTDKIFLNSTATLDGSTAGEIKGTGIFTADNIKRGTGFPNGVVTANVGTVYIDTDVTNGASSWIKKSGTGNTGWQVLEGDTGWRQITSLAPAGNVTSGNFDIRRKGDTVLLRLRGLAMSGANAVMIANFRADIGTGFEPVDNINAISKVNTSGVVTTSFLVLPASTTQGIVRYDSGAATYAAASWACVTAWPTTLPGTATT